MLCKSIRPRMHTFLDDLLDEKDYQEIQAHLACCERCRAYASSVGTLSYRLYELGQVSVPPGMSSAILYEFEKKSHAAPAAPAASLRQDKSVTDMTAILTRLSWAAVLSILTAAVFTVATLVSHRRALPPPAPVSVPVIEEEKPKATQILWHYHISRSSRNELKQIFRDLYLTVLDESPNQFALDVPNEKLGEFAGRIAGLSGVVKEYGEIDPSMTNAGAVRVSVYLE